MLIEAKSTQNTNEATRDILESNEQGVIILSPADKRPFRRIVYLDNYGGASMWEKIKKGEVPPHHLRGCLELVRMGYEVALAEPVPDFLPRRPIPHDLKLLKLVRSWLGRDDIVYCGHNVLYWIPLLRSLRLVRPHIVSHLWAYEPLDWAGAHSGIIALTPAGAQQARKLAPKAKVAALGWGADLNSFPKLPYRPDWLLHCGIAGRDFPTLSKAATLSQQPLRVIGSWLPDGLNWPPNATVIDGGKGFNFQDKKVSFHDLLHTHYAGSAASLVINIADSEKKHALGFTNVIEALAMSQPVILTRSGAMPEEFNVEREGCGFEVPPEDPPALAKAMDVIMNDRSVAEEMGRNARRLCETRFNMTRYSNDLHQFFQAL
jgi:glycosyltransferase involved in cell wall biosynthesis